MTLVKYSTYDKELNAVIHVLYYWSHYLLLHELVLYFDHEALRFLNSKEAKSPTQ